MFAKLIDEIIATYKADPRNKVYIDEKTLLAAAIEETGGQITIEQVRKVIAKYMSGEMDDAEQVIYDGAAYACGVAARHCFADDPDAEVDYEIDWLENSDGSYMAEVRPC